MLEALDDDTQPLDIARQRAVCETAQTLINSLKIEVELHAILQGSIDVPFIESQSSERRSSMDRTFTPGERNQGVVAGGPGANHRWRNAPVSRLRTRQLSRKP
ncbi:MAG TPA: hypothetical protein VMR43_18610 [Variovorax sp.]|nr:hypothetical protein [Variovorax sp.]